MVLILAQQRHTGRAQGAVLLRILSWSWAPGG
jgi:hypothetical protein